MSWKWWIRELQELIPPLKQSLSWQKLAESTFLEVWNQIKNLTVTKWVLNEERSRQIWVRKCCGIFAYMPVIPNFLVQQQPREQRWRLGAGERNKSLVLKKSCFCILSYMTVLWGTSTETYLYFGLLELEQLPGWCLSKTSKSSRANKQVQ